MARREAADSRRPLSGRGEGWRATGGRCGPLAESRRGRGAGRAWKWSPSTLARPAPLAGFSSPGLLWGFPSLGPLSAASCSPDSRTTQGASLWNPQLPDASGALPIVGGDGVCPNDGMIGYQLSTNLTSEYFNNKLPLSVPIL